MQVIIRPICRWAIVVSITAATTVKHRLLLYGLCWSRRSWRRLRQVRSAILHVWPARPAPLLVVIWPAVYTNYIIIVINITSDASQFCGIIMIKTRCATRTTTGNALVRVLLLVSIGINHTLRACISVAPNRWPEYTDRIILHIHGARSCGIIYSINAWALVCITLDVDSPRTGNILSATA